HGRVVDEDVHPGPPFVRVSLRLFYRQKKRRAAETLNAEPIFFACAENVKHAALRASAAPVARVKMGRKIPFCSAIRSILRKHHMWGVEVRGALGHVAIGMCCVGGSWRGDQTS